jgi:DNA-binding NtrC family response regulator
LRERPGDIPVLARHFAKKYSELNEIPLRPLAREAEDRLAAYLWPGNVRELENTVHRAVLMGTGAEIGPEAVILQDPSAVIGQEQPKAGNTLADMERSLIIDTMKSTLGSQAAAARILGISIRALSGKLRKYQEEGFEW